MNMFQSIILAIIVGETFTTIHELGHFACARIFRRQINEFCIGCGPIIYKNGIFVLRLLPFVGYNMIEMDSNSTNIKEQKENFFIFISGYMADTILTIFICPFSNTLCFALLLSISICIIFEYVALKNSDTRQTNKTKVMF